MADSARGNWGASGSLGLSAQRIVESLNLNRSVFVKDKFPNNVYTEVGKAKRRETKGQLVAILGLVSDKRRLVLIPQQSRVLCKNEIHELLTTDEVDAKPNKVVDRVGVIGFFEVSQGGSVAVGDPLFINGKKRGKVAGFDETHFPNHYNVVIHVPRKFTGLEAGFKLGDELKIEGSMEA